MKTADAAAISPIEEVLQVRVIDLLESPTNPRKTYDPAKLQALADSIEAAGGIKVPLVVRPLPGRAAHEIVVGHRRFRAAKLLKLATVPALVRPLSDEEATELQQIENLERADVDPVEAAEGWAWLIARHGSVEAAAARMGKPAREIAQAARLAALVPEAKAALARGALGLDVARVLAPLPAASQEAMLSACSWGEGKGKTYQPVEAFRRRVQEQVLQRLSAVPWPLEDATLVPAAGACTTCPKRTGAQTLLFPGVKADACTDATCFREKRAAWLARVTADEAAKSGGASPVLISESYTSHEKGVLGAGTYVLLGAGMKTCKARVPAVGVDGASFGRVVSICRERTCPIHGAREASAGSRAIVRRQTQARRKQAVAGVVRQRIFQATIAAVKVVDPAVILDTLMDRLWHDDLRKVIDVMGYAGPQPPTKTATGKPTAAWERNAQRRAAAERTIKGLTGRAQAQAIMALALGRALGAGPSQAAAAKDPLLLAAKRLKVDVAGITRAVLAAAAKKTRKAAPTAKRAR